jgi:hypothetical protein
MNNKFNPLNIFNKSKKKNENLIPFNTQINPLGEIKYFPPVSKEWKNSIYVFNKNPVLNLSAAKDIIINSLVKHYFNIRFIPKFIFKKYKPRWVRRPSMNKIYVSNAEIKHTNSKAILTVYNYNRERLSLLNKVRKLKNSFFVNILLLINNNNKHLKNFSNKTLKNLLYKELKILRRYKFKLNLNSYKFEEKLLYKLSSIIGLYFNKKVEFNIVNMKSLILNSDIFTKILAAKLWKKKIKTLRMMSYILNKAVLPKVNRIIEKSKIKKNVDSSLLQNRFKNISLISVLHNTNFNQLLYEIYNTIFVKNNLLNKDYNEMYKILFNSIKYKNMAGVRLEVKGRLTKRYRADRAVFKVKWKGGLKNIYSSYKGLSALKKRGYLNSNVEYSVLASKRRIGSFAVKGWISGK